MTTLRAYDNADVGLNIYKEYFFGRLEDEGSIDDVQVRPTGGGKVIATINFTGNSLVDTGTLYGTESGGSLIANRILLSERGAPVVDITGIPRNFGDIEDCDLSAAMNGNDKIFGNSFSDRITGYAGNDSLYGNGGNDRLFDDKGRDLLNGGKGHDRLSGGLDVDRLWGDSGNDRLDGGQGNDRLTGGTGTDTFVFRQGGGYDTIRDFNANGDRIEIASGATRFRDLTIKDIGDDVTVQFGNVMITLLDADAARITGSDFIFT